MEQLTRLARGQTMVVTPDQRQYHDPSLITTSSGVNLGQMVSGEIPTLVLPQADAAGHNPAVAPQGAYPNIVIDPHCADSVHLDMRGVTQQAFAAAMAAGGDVASAFRLAAQMAGQPKQAENKMSDTFLSSASQLFGAPPAAGNQQPVIAPAATFPPVYQQQPYQPQQQYGAGGLAARFNKQPSSARVPAGQPLVNAAHPECDVLFELRGMPSQIPTRYHAVAASEKALVLLFDDTYQGPPPFIPPATAGQDTMYVEVPSLRTVFEVFVPELMYHAMNHLHVVLLINASRPLD